MVAKKAKKEYIFEWPFQSTKETAGRRANYSVLLATDGTLSCNCPGWVFYRDKTKPRACKHTEHSEVKTSYKNYLKMHKKGEPLPHFESNGTDITVGKPKTTTQTDVAFSRCIMLD